ncbi:Protein kinase [Vigna unguiculata]|uniref:non-specific serine/threonine protein kinase n=1 Tax=Vigna unguiculata TaxID=3917 RepID=A0A4D6N7H0_VIGUN|nr:Protein kinase [Vigna unguiculata]
MEETREDAGPTEQGPSNVSWWPSDFVENFGSVSLDSNDEALNNKESPVHVVKDVLSSQKASQTLWRTGMLSEPIPNGFYSVVPETRLKELFDNIPSLDELHALSGEGFKADVILVDSEKDKKLSMLKQLIVALVKGLNSNPAAIIKKIAGLGLPNDGVTECQDSYKHISLIVVLNSVEMLVDLMRFPGQLLPRSTKAVFMTHISGAGESDSAENDSCDSPLEPNSPLFGVSESVEKEESLQFHRKFEPSSNALGLSLRNVMLRSNSSLSLSHSEPNVGTTLGRRSRRKIIAEQRTASSSPEHPSFRARGRSMLSGDRTAFRDFTDDQATSRSSYRSDGASSSSEARRIRRRSVSITPEIGDDIVRAVRAMNETLKQNRLLRERGDDNSTNNNSSDANLQKNVSNFHLDGHDALYSLQHDHGNSQKAMSLPSSPHDYRGHSSERSGPSRQGVNDEMESTWNKVLESPMFNNKPLLPYEKWNIDFSELTVGTRVGIGFFGEVFRGIWNGTDVAIKVFLEQDLTAENMEDFCNEISILSRLRHPNVILFLGACTKPPRLSMVTEYMELGSLYYLIHLSGQKKKLNWRRRLRMLRDICKGLMCIHRMKIVHRDLKSANCLVNKHWTVKICDFGLSRLMAESPMRDSSSAGTPEWMAPELIRNEPFTEKCDIFSLGVIMWELCTLSRPWEGIPPERVVYSVAHEASRLEIPEGPLGRLISDCWAESHERPSCEEILSRLVDIEYSLC